MASILDRHGPPGSDIEVAKSALLKIVRAIARQAAREDHEKTKMDWRKKPRKRVLESPAERVARKLNK